MSKPIWIHKKPELGLTSVLKGWPMRPTWIVEALAPGIDYFVIAGFPTWEDAVEWCDHKGYLEYE